MVSPKAPRYQGRITSWKDDQGFGFITPNGGGVQVFVHIKSFDDRSTRPTGQEIVTYHLESNERGQPRAANVAFVRSGSARPMPANKNAGSPMSAGAVFIALGFLGISGLCTLSGKIPPIVFAYYLAMSAVAFAAYALDKSAAQAGRWRTKEKTLHMLGLAGGWPGALLAQRILRHKSKKQSFQAASWLTVIVNCAALCWLIAAPGGASLRTALGAS